MAVNVTVQDGNFVEITGFTADDWIGSTELDGTPKNVKIMAIQFVPSAIADRMIVRNGGVDAAAIFDSGVHQTLLPTRIPFPKGEWCNPVIDFSDCTFGIAANVKVMMVLG